MNPENPFIQENQEAIKARLTAREYEIFNRRFCNPVIEETLRSIATSYGLSHERIRQILEKCLRKLAHEFKMDRKLLLESLGAGSEPLSPQEAKKFTEDVLKLTNTHLNFYKKLDLGIREPTTEAQRHFVAVCRGTTEAETQHELAYLLYKKSFSKVISKEKL